MHQNDELTGEHEPFAESPAASTPPAGSPEPAPQPPPGRRSRRKWLYITAIMALGMLTAVPEALDPAERMGERFGGGISLLMGSFFIASLFYAWKPSTRPLIPGAALIASFFLVRALHSDASRETEEQFAALQHLADSAYSEGADAPPRDNDARMLWATRKAMEDLLAHYDTLALAHGVDVERAPDAWLTAAYIADARKYPEVRTYLTRYRAYLRDADSTVVGVVSQRLRARLTESGLPRRHVDRFMAGAMESVSERGERRRIATELELVDRALEFHAFLVAVDARVHLDEAGEAAMFDRDPERLRAMEMGEQIDRLALAAEQQQRTAMNGLREMGAVLGIEADTLGREIPPAGPGTSETGVRRS